MALHLQKEINSIKKQLMILSGIVENNVLNSITSILNRNSFLAIKVIESDQLIDNLEVKLEQECLIILALHQPVAKDLRFITAILRINNDLERIGDIAVNLAKRAYIFNAQRAPTYVPDKFAKCANLSISLLKKTLNAFVNFDAISAHEVLKSDQEIDDLCKEMYADIKDEICKRPEMIDVLSHVLLLPRFVERIADHATNIAEAIIYILEGEIVRHQKSEK